MFGHAQSQYTTIPPPAFMRGIHIQQAQQQPLLVGIKADGTEINVAIQDSCVCVICALSTDIHHQIIVI